jgi:hypothetical protein
LQTFIKEVESSNGAFINGEKRRWKGATMAPSNSGQQSLLTVVWERALQMKEGFT